jgi:hypothetical protein
MKNAFVGCAVALTIAAVLYPCPLLSHERVKTTVTFDREIVRILNRKCISCHSENNIGFAMTSYEQTRPWARALEDEVLRRRMPPWRAIRGYGQFANDVGLTSRELNTFVAWAEGNGPKSKDQRLIVNLDQGETPESERLRPDFTRWQLGTPELVKATDAYSITPGQGDGVRRTVIDLELKTERWIRALEFKPDDRRTVRAVFFSLQETGQWLGSWTPWYGFTMLPPPIAYRVPAGSHVVAEVHYRSTNEPVQDKGTLGIYWASGPAAQHPTDLVMEAKPDGTPSETRQKFSASVKVGADLNILAFKPEVMPGLESVELSARKPDGTKQVLLLLRDILPEWPTPYILKEPLTIPGGSELAVIAYYRNSAASQPPANVKLTASVFNAATPAASARAN